MMQSNWEFHSFLVRMQKLEVLGSYLARLKHYPIKYIFIRWLDQATPTYLPYDNLGSHKNLHINVSIFL